MEKQIKRLVVAVLAAFLVAGLPYSPAAARDKGYKTNLEGRLNLTWPALSTSKLYSPIPQGTNNNGTIVNTPENCRELASCDVMQVNVDPTGITEAFYVELKLEWPNHCVPSSKPGEPPVCPPTSINLNIHMWEPTYPKDDPSTPLVDESKDPQTGKQAEGEPDWLGRNTSTDKHPETFKFAADVDKKVHFYILIVNASAKANPDQINPYKLTAAFKLASFEDYDPCKPGTTDPSCPTNTPSPTPKKSPARAVTDLSLSSPKPTLSPVKVPGADGPLTEQTLVAFAGEKKTSGGDEEKSSPLVMGVIGLAVLGAATFGFFFIRGRRIPSS